MKTLEKPQFTFKADTHSYYLDGKPLTGVTTILGVIAKPALIPWAVGCAIDWLKEHPEDWDGAKKAHAQKRDDAAEKGTDVHALVEEYVNRCIKEGGSAVLENNENDQVDKFISWACENDIKFLASEQKVYSVHHWYAGTFDILLEKDGKVYIADIKTGKAVYETYFYQMAGYRVALEEMTEPRRPNIDGAMVIRLGKDGSFEVKERLGEAFEVDRKAFLGALDIYRANATYAPYKPKNKKCRN